MKGASCVLAHWAFSLDVYGSDSVAVSCLTLQDDIGVDVNVLLLSLLASLLKHRPLSLGEIDAADQLIRHWREDIVVALRCVRRQLKGGPSPAPNADTNALRNAVKVAELNAEKIQQGILAEWMDGLPVMSATRHDRSEEGLQVLHQVGRHVVDYYLDADTSAGERSLAKPELYRLAGVVATAAYASKVIDSPL